MQARAPRTSRTRRCVASGLVALALACVTGTARADDEQQFELVKGLFYAGEYEDVVKRLAILLDPSNPACSAVAGAATAPQTCHLADGVLIERSYEMKIVALVALKREVEADKAIEKLLEANPSYSVFPGSLPPAVVARITEVKSRMQSQLEAKAQKDADAQRKAALAAQRAAEEERRWLAEVTKLAGSETVVERRSRVLAFVPFGVGQFQNGDVGWGIFFAASQTLAGGASIGFAVAHSYYVNFDRNTVNPQTGEKVIPDELHALAEGAALGNQIAFGTWAALVVAGIVQANVAFEPEVVKTRDRPVPKRPTPPVLPQVAVTPGGMFVGVTGVF